MFIEDTFSSRGRVRVLKVLSRTGELNISEIVRRAQLNYTVTNRHLQALRQAGLVQEKRFGKVRIFRFASENPRAKAVRDFIALWEG